MTTARDLITLSFRESGVLGVGQDLLAQDANDGLSYLSGMMAQWQARRWLVPAQVTVNALGNSAESNTIGPAAHWALAIRPVYISSGYAIQQNTGSNPVSLPLKQIYSRENYNLIAIKSLNTLPTSFFYDGNWPLGNVYVWPIPSTTYRIYLTVMADLVFPKVNGEASLDAEFELPPEYMEAIRLNLAIRFCSAYGRMPLPTTVSLAKVALNTIKNNNAQISEIVMPAGLVQGRAFNLFNADGL